MYKSEAVCGFVVVKGAIPKQGFGWRHAMLDAQWAECVRQRTYVNTIILDKRLLGLPELDHVEVPLWKRTVFPYVLMTAVQYMHSVVSSMRVCDVHFSHYKSSG